jgi:hypothetical protein
VPVTIQYDQAEATIDAEELEGERWTCAADPGLAEFLNGYPRHPEYSKYLFQPDPEMAEALAVCAEAKELGSQARVVRFTKRPKREARPKPTGKYAGLEDKGIWD